MYTRVHHISMIHTFYRLEQELGLNEEAIASNLGVPRDTLDAWRKGLDKPHQADLRRLNDLLALGEDLANTRSGKYRQA